MKYCAYCGAKNRNAAEQCTDCGRRRFEFHCANCGEVFTDAPRCPECGVKAGRSKRTCQECGAVHFETVCPECGAEYVKGAKSTARDKAVTAGKDYHHTHQIAPTCPKCGGDNVTVQMVSESQLKNANRSCLWWLFVGWWWVPLKWLLFFGLALLAKIFAPRRKKLKTQHVSMFVCQICGHTWRGHTTKARI